MEDEIMVGLIDELGGLKAKADGIAARMREIRQTLDAEIDFGDKATAHLYGQRFKIKVERKSEIKWNQDRIEALRGLMPEADFTRLFKWTYSHSGKKILDDYLASSPFRDDIRDACEVIERTNAYTYDAIEMEA
jgi:hypothetical protein